MKHSLYTYKAKVISVYDGDTCTVDIDLGLNTWVRGEKLRLHRINAPEMRGAEKVEGKKSRDFLRGKILDKEITLQSIKDKKGKYGRYLAEIWIEDENENEININDFIVSEGFAVYKDY
jgi:micrococcal nuclease